MKTPKVKVKALRKLSGVAVGEVVALPANQARALVAIGHAEYAAKAKKPTARKASK